MAKRFSNWAHWVLLVWVVAGLCFGIWQGSKLAYAVALVVVVGLVLKVLDDRRHRLRGYRVEYLPPAIVRAGEHDFAVVYREDPEHLYFNGIAREPPERNLLFVPGEGQWDGTVAPWARGRRDVILERLQTNPIVRRCEIAEGERP